MTEKMVILVFQIAVILITTRLMGLFFVKVLRQPASLGEIVCGILIGPYLLGGIQIPFIHHSLFPLTQEGATIPVSPELYGFAIIASIILLFLSGLETDLPTFLRFAGKGSFVGFGGALLSFVLGYLCAIFFLPESDLIGGSSKWLSPTALFLGILSTATSVGITARILTDKKKMGSPEGVTILAAAVLDDVLGIILLAIVVGISGQGDFSIKSIGIVSLKAFCFWIGCTVLGIFLIPYFTRKLKKLKSLSVITGIAFGMALLLAGLSEMVGLAMIIGAYIMGLSFSQTDIAPKIRENLEALSEFLVPIFFCVMGMMVDFRAMNGVILFGLIYTFFAILGKMIGCGIPALFSGFNLKGGIRIGLGMLPRGEVALIIAGIGLSSGAISQKYFGVSVLMLLITTLMAPPLLVSSFNKGVGYKNKFKKTSNYEDVLTLELNLVNFDLAMIFRRNLVQSFRQEEFFVRLLENQEHAYAIQKDNISITVTQEGPIIKILFSPDQETFVRLLVVEEVLQFQSLFEGLKNMEKPDMLGAKMMLQMFEKAEKIDQKC